MQSTESKDTKFKENDQISTEELIYLTKLQLNGQNLSINYLKHYNATNEFYDWFVSYIDDNLINIENIIILYDQVDRLRFTGKVLYEFLFIDILKFLPKIDLKKNLNLQFQALFIDQIKFLNIIREEVRKINEIEYEILKYSLLLTLLDTNLDLLKENFIIIIAEKGESHVSL